MNSLVWKFRLMQKEIVITFNQIHVESNFPYVIRFCSKNKAINIRIEEKIKSNC